MVVGKMEGSEHAEKTNWIRIGPGMQVKISVIVVSGLKNCGYAFYKGLKASVGIQVSHFQLL